MNQPLFTFDARTIAPAIGFENWLPGWYPLRIVKSNLKTTQDGEGGYIELTVEALDGPMRGQLNWIRLNTRNKNAQTVEIAQKTLSAICHVTNVHNIAGFQVDDAAVPMLHNIPFQALCVITKNKDTGRESNNWNAFKDMQGNQPGKSGGGPMNQPGPGTVQQPGQPQGQPQTTQPAQPQAWQAPGQPTAPAPAPSNQGWGNPPPNPAPNPNQAPTWQQSPKGDGNAGGPWNR